MGLLEGRGLRHSVLSPAAHSLHECTTGDEFCASFEALTQHSPQRVIDQFVKPSAAKAIFLTGSIPLGIATNGSDVDFVVMVDSREDLLVQGRKAANSDQHLAFSNDSDSLKAGTFMTVMSGVTVEVAVVVARSVVSVYQRLRQPGPELSESEVMMLGRMSSGWLLSQDGEYLDTAGVQLSDPALRVYCGTRYFSYALIYQLKATRALNVADTLQALHLGRLSIEMGYLAYFASEGFPYLGPKWLAMLGHAHSAASRLARHPLLGDGLPLLFPASTLSAAEATMYLDGVSKFVISLRGLIEQRLLFRIAFQACPQIQ